MFSLGTMKNKNKNVKGLKKKRNKGRHRSNGINFGIKSLSGTDFELVTTILPHSDISSGVKFLRWLLQL